MKAICWNGIRDVRVERVPDPEILNPHDAILRVTSTAICGSDLHLYDGYIPAMTPGDILGHEFMGEVVEVGHEVKRIKKGDRVTVPFPIACGSCYFCQHDMFSLCDNTNPHAAMVEKLWGYSPSGIFGYSQLLGGYAGGQAQFVRVPFADVGMLTIPDGLTDEQVLFLTDILPTGYMAAENCNITPGDVVAVFGCGPVGQFAVMSARLLGAERIIAIDLVPERLALAAEKGKAETIDASQADVVQQLKQMTGGRGPDAVIDAVGMEAHGFGAFGVYDRVKQSLLLENDRAFVLRQAILACRKGGTLSIAGVYSEFADKVPVGAVMNKGLTVRTGQTHVQKYQAPLLERIQRGEIDPTVIITHVLPLEDAPTGYRLFKHKREGCIKVVLKPW
jgi:threonine dehydrogenase-like Zn-dependent dehydrogenase